MLERCTNCPFEAINFLFCDLKKIAAIQVSCHFISTSLILSNYSQETGFFFYFQDFMITNPICN